MAGSNKVKIDTNALVSSWMWFFRRSDAFERNEWSNYTNWQTVEKPYTLLQSSDIAETVSITGYNNQVTPSENIMYNDTTTNTTEIEYVNNLFTCILTGK